MVWLGLTGSDGRELVLATDETQMCSSWQYYDCRIADAAVANEVEAGWSPRSGGALATSPSQPHVCVKQSWRDYGMDIKNACVP